MSTPSKWTEGPAHKSIFLPVAAPVVFSFLARGQTPELAIERAALLVLMVFHCRTGLTVHDVCGALGEAEQLFLEQPEEKGRAALLDFRASATGLTEDTLPQVLRSAGLTLVDQEAMDQQIWRGPLGRFHPIFQERCRTVVQSFAFKADDTNLETSAALNLGSSGVAELYQPRRTTVHVSATFDQSRFVTKVAADPQELHALHGYAGTGKTHVTAILQERLGGVTHVLLRADDREAFKQRTGLTNIKAVTLGQIAHRMVTDQFRGKLSRRMVPPSVGPGHFDLDRQAREIGIPSAGVGQQAAAVVMGHLIQVIRKFCRTDGDAIDPLMFTGKGYNPSDISTLVALAERLWEAMFEPLQANAPRPFAVWEYHLAKWLTLRGARMPLMGFLVIDEGHDLAPAWMQLLSSYPGGLLLMGDPYQRLAGIARAPEHMIRSTLAQSVRTGQQAIPLITGVLREHSESLMDDELHGAREHDTWVRSYAHRDDVRDMGLRVYGSVWQLFADAMRMRECGNAFSVLHPSFIRLKAVLNDALALYKFGDKPRRLELAGIRSREALEGHLATIGQDKVRRLLAGGFGFDDATRFAQDVVQNNLDATVPGWSGITLGLIEHTRNLESSVVFMSPCCFAHMGSPSAQADRDRHLRAIYLSMTRVRDELWVPQDALEKLSLSTLA